MMELDEHDVMLNATRAYLDATKAPGIPTLEARRPAPVNTDLDDHEVMLTATRAYIEARKPLG